MKKHIVMLACSAIIFLIGCGLIGIAQCPPECGWWEGVCIGGAIVCCVGGFCLGAYSAVQCFE